MSFAPSQVHVLSSAPCSHADLFYGKKRSYTPVLKNTGNGRFHLEICSLIQTRIQARQLDAWCYRILVHLESKEKSSLHNWYMKVTHINSDAVIHTHSSWVPTAAPRLLWTVKCKGTLWDDTACVCGYFHFCMSSEDWSNWFLLIKQHGVASQITVTKYHPENHKS